jgi:hypothetical protein
MSIDQGTSNGAHQSSLQAQTPPLTTGNLAVHERSMNTGSNDHAMQRWLVDRDDIPDREFDTEGWMRLIQSDCMAEEIEQIAASSANKQEEKKKK